MVSSVSFLCVHDASQTGLSPLGFNSYYEAIIGCNASWVIGKRAPGIVNQNDGWSFAPPTVDAANSIGMKPRQKLIDNANAKFCWLRDRFIAHVLVCRYIFDVSNGHKSYRTK